MVSVPKTVKDWFWPALALTAPFWPYLAISENAAVPSLRLILALSGLWFGLSFFRGNRGGRRMSPLFFWLGIFTLWAAGSVFWAENFSWAARKAIYLLNFFGAAFLASWWLAGFREERLSLMKVILKAFVWSGWLVGLIGVAQFLAQFFIPGEKIFRFWVLNISPLFNGRAMSELVLDFPSWFFDFHGQPLMRAVSVFPDPHMLAFFAGMTGFLSLGIFLAERKKRYLFGGLFLILTLILTFSRGGYLGFLAGLLFLLPFFWKRADFSFKKGIFIFGLFLLGLGVFFGGPILGRFTSSFDLSEGSNQGRLEIWRQALDFFWEKPFLGHGLSSYPLLVDPALNYKSPVSAHNLYLEILTELGLLGLLFFSAWFFGALKKSFRQKSNPLFLGIFSALVFFAVHSLFELPLYQPVVIFLLCFLLLFVGHCERTKKDERL